MIKDCSYIAQILYEIVATNYFIANAMPSFIIKLQRFCKKLNYHFDNKKVCLCFANLKSYVHLFY